MTIIKHSVSNKTGKDYFCVAVRKTSSKGNTFDIPLTFDQRIILELIDLATLAGLAVGDYIEI